MVKKGKKIVLIFVWRTLVFLGLLISLFWTLLWVSKPGWTCTLHILHVMDSSDSSLSETPAHLLATCIKFAQPKLFLLLTFPNCHPEKVNVQEILPRSFLSNYMYIIPVAVMSRVDFFPLIVLAAAEAEEGGGGGGWALSAVPARCLSQNSSLCLTITDTFKCCLSLKDTSLRQGGAGSYLHQPAPFLGSIHTGHLLRVNYCLTFSFHSIAKNGYTTHYWTF